MLSQTMRKFIYALIFIQFVSLSFLALNNAVYTWDEASYIINAMDIAGQQINPVMQQYIAHERHPLLSWIIAGIFVLGLPLFLYKILPFISLFLFFLLIYKIGKEFYDKDTGLIAGLILITIPTFVFLSAKVLTDIPGALLFSLCLYCYYEGLKKPNYFLLGGFFGGIAIMMRDMNVLLIPILIIFGIFFRKQIHKLNYFLSIPVALVSLLPYFIDNYLRWGNPFFRILNHISMVKQGVGYQSFAVQNLSLAWIIFLPLFIGIPVFLLFVFHLYKNRTKLYSSPRLRYLLVWFFVPFFIFIVRQKISPRLIPIFAIPVVLLGVHEMLARQRFKAWLAVILIINGLFVFNIFVYSQIAISPSHKEMFNFITANIPEDEAIGSNTSPPSLVAWYTNRTILFDLNPDYNETINYYLYDNTYEKYLKRTKFNPGNYNILFNNSKYILYEKSSHFPGAGSLSSP